MSLLYFSQSILGGFILVFVLIFVLQFAFGFTFFALYICFVRAPFLDILALGTLNAGKLSYERHWLMAVRRVKEWKFYLRRWFLTRAMEVTNTRNKKKSVYMFASLALCIAFVTRFVSSDRMPFLRAMLTWYSPLQSHSSWIAI